MLKVLFTVVAAGLIAGCSSLGALNAVLPKDGATSKVIKDVPYGVSDRQSLDIYIPTLANTGEEALPVVVFFYGGSWSSGSKNEYGFVGSALNSKGYVAVLADYRLVPEVRYPDFVFDSANAVAWVAENIAEHGGDPDNLFIAGHSAGAYNAMMAGLAEQVYEDQNVNLPDVAGVIGLAGPYDFLPMKWPATRAAFKGSEELDATQPVNFLTQDSPPLLLITGVDDVRVDPRHSHTMNRLATDRGARAKLHTYPDVGHAKLLLSLARPFRGWAPTLEDIHQFVKRHVR